MSEHDLIPKHHDRCVVRTKDYSRNRNEFEKLRNGVREGLMIQVGDLAHRRADCRERGSSMIACNTLLSSRTFTTTTKYVTSE